MAQLTNEIIKYTWTGSGSVTNAYSGAGALSLVTGAATTQPRILGTLWIFGTTIASSAAAVNIKISRDSSGDEIVVPDKCYYPTSYQTGSVGFVSFPLLTGQTTATDATVVVDIEVPCFYADQTLYLWVKTDTGTFTATEAVLTARL